jgi:hypothetical protein
VKRSRSLRLAPPRPSAVGRLSGRSSWVGFVETDDGFHLVVGGPHGSLRHSLSTGSARRLELLAAAAAHYAEALDPPPPGLEATQADLGDLVRWLGAVEGERKRRAQLAAVVDAIDDGLAGEVVLSRLSAAIRDETKEEQADLVDLLVARLKSLDPA